MARIFIDGFESGDASSQGWTGSGHSVIAARPGFSGNYCLEVSVLTDYCLRTIPLKSELYVALKYEPNVASSTTSGIISFCYGSTVLVSIQRTTANYVRAQRGTSTTLQTATEKPLLVDNVYLIEVHVKIGDSDGVVQVKVNGTMVIDYSGDTKPGSDTQFNTILLGYITSGYYGYGYYDDIVLDDANWIGNTKIQGIVPNGAGTTTQWTPSAGNNWDCVDEVPPSDSDYVSVNSVDQVDLYSASNLSGTIGSIKCVQVQARCVQEGAPTPTSLKLGLRTGGTNYWGSSQTVPSGSPNGLVGLWEQNPNTSSDWTESDVNGLEIGIQSAA